MLADTASSTHGAEGSLNLTAPTERLFHQAVRDIAERAKGVLPECHDRIERAVQLLLAGEVQALLDGTVQVRDPEQAGVVYHVQDTCPCAESAQAPRGWCVHRLAGAIAKRASALMQTRLETPGVAVQPEPPVPPEAEDSVVLERATIPPQYIQHIHGKPFVRYAGLLAMAHAHGLEQLEATFISVTEALAVAQATAIFRMDAALPRAATRRRTTCILMCGPTSRAWPSPGPRRAPCAMPSMLACVRLRNWSEPDDCGKTVPQLLV